MLNFKEIIEGWRNHLVPPVELKEMIDGVARERMIICNGCPLQSDNAKAAGTYNGIRFDLHCTKCGCPLAAKTKSLSSSCPIGNWTAITSDTEQYTIEQSIRTHNENNTLQ